MATADLYDPTSTEDAKGILAENKAAFGRQQYRESVRLTLKYSQDQQLQDVEKELRDRYNAAQVGSRGGQIRAQMIPLTQRYIDEAATAYNRDVTRVLVDEDGQESEATKRVTEANRRMLDDASYDLHMHAMEKIVIPNRACGLWYQERAGKLRPQIITPDNLAPLPPSERSWFDPADQSDYKAHVVQLDGTKGEDLQWAWTEPAQTGFYAGRTGDGVNGGIDWRSNDHEWPQTVDTEDNTGSTSMLPLQMLTYWHRDKVVGQLLPDIDAGIARLNREINVQWSVLLDTIGMQGWAQLVLSLHNKNAPPQNMLLGSRFALSLGVDESADLLSSAINYTDLVTALGSFVRLMAMALRQSPNDFSLEGQKAMSGFAKLIDMLPKLEARADRVAVLAQQERDIAWPRLAVIGKKLGYFSESIEALSKLRLKTTFGEIDIPLSTAEKVQQEEHDIRHGITSPARIVAQREGISIEDAQMMVDENIGTTKTDDDGGEEATGGMAPAPATEDVQKTALNGAQVTSMVETVKAAASGELPRDSAIAILRVGFRLSQQEAEDIIATVGTDAFTPPAQQGQQPPQQPPPEPGQRQGRLAGLIGRVRGDDGT